MSFPPTVKHVNPPGPGEPHQTRETPSGAIVSPEAQRNEALEDEMAAINSIYGNGTLVPAGDTGVFILVLPWRDTSLRIFFPPTYPHDMPRFLGCQHAGAHARKGDAASAQEACREALTRLHQPGSVCVFDMMEDVRARDATEPAAGTEPPLPQPPCDRVLTQEVPPQWYVSESLTKMKSVFVAHCIRVDCPLQANRFVDHLVARKQLRGATHHITAWRIRGQNGVTYQDSDDGGEQAAGARLLRLMQLMDLWDAMVIVSRWYGGVQLGPRRFAIINTVARDAFLRAGFAALRPNTKNSKRLDQ